MAASRLQRQQIRDIVLTHAHLDHIAGLPLFIDDLFAVLTEPIRIHASAEVIEVLERDIFNWSVYPRFSELTNENGAVIEYKPFETGTAFPVRHLEIRAINVNHKVPSTGFLVSDGKASFALTGDTAGTDEFWNTVNKEKKLDAILIECAFPNDLQYLADLSHHLTPAGLRAELEKLDAGGCTIFVVNIKPMYRERTVSQIEELKIPDLEILETGKVYEW